MLMTNYIINAGIVSFIFFLLVFLRDKYITKKEGPIKNLVMDSLVVFISSILAEYSINHMDKGLLKPQAPRAFLGKPEF